MTDWLDEIGWDDRGLVPAIAQDRDSGEVLMVAWMNREALRLTVEQKRAVYWSRSRGKLWFKGEESSHQQRLHEIRLDCDADVVLLVPGLGTRGLQGGLSRWCRHPGIYRTDKGEKIR